MTDIKSLAEEITLQIHHANRESFDSPVHRVKFRHHADLIQEALERVQNETETKDYEDMRRFQLKFIEADQELRKLKESLQARIELDGRDFYDLCQLYRHAPIDKPAMVVEAFEELKSWLRDNIKVKNEP